MPQGGNHEKSRDVRSRHDVMTSCHLTFSACSLSQYHPFHPFHPFLANARKINDFEAQAWKPYEAMNIAGFLTPAFGRTWQTSCMRWQKPAVTMRPESPKVTVTRNLQ